MFGQLILSGDADAPDTIRWDDLVSSSGVLPEEPLDAVEAKPYLDTVRDIVTSVYAALPTDNAMRAERQRVEQAVLRLVPWLTEGDLEPPQGFDFTIRCAIAHHRLPEPQRLAREARIAAVLDGVLSEPAWRKKVQATWDAMKMVAVVVPDPMLETELRSNACVEITRAIGKGQLDSLAVLAPVWRAFLPAREKLKDAFDPVASIVADAYLTRPVGEQAAFLALLSRLVKSNQCTWFLQVRQAIDEEFGENICIADQGTIQVRVLTAWFDTRDNAVRPSVLRYELDRMHGQDRMRIVEMVQMLLDAVAAGVPLGDAYVARIRQCLLDEEDAFDSAQQGMDARSLRTRRIAEATVEGPAHSARDEPDVDPVHAWSVSRLLAWIEGPVTQKPIDRQRIAARERALREARSARATTRPTDDSDTDEAGDGAEDTDDDINLVVDDALQATAAFFLGDLNDLLSLATQLNLPAALLDACRRSRETMAMLARQQDIAHPGNDQDTMAALVAAEAAIANLRGQIRGAQADDRQRMSFTDALARALASEPLEWGKRHGGVIACPLPLTSWAWVHQEFHGRWLFDMRHVEVNGHTVPLRPDQALALYVTGTSRSEFAFDVSVHLWHRRPGSAGPASRDEGGWRQMNRTDWFDTYIPCAVLHVPRGS